MDISSMEFKQVFCKTCFKLYIEFNTNVETVAWHVNFLILFLYSNVLHAAGVSYEQRL